MTITLNPRSVAMFCAGLAAAAIALIVFNAVTAEAFEEGESTFVPTTPCRLFDTRSTDVGDKDTPIGEDESHDFQVTGTNGDCVIPDEATAISINLTGLNASTSTNLRAYPADADLPNAAVLNVGAGQAPLPNKIDVKLSTDGELAIYNRFGTVDVIGDVMGYYREDGLVDVEARLAALEMTASAQDAKISAQDAKIVALEAKLASVTVETVDGQPTVRFSGVNVQVVDGSGTTGGTVTGLGNLIVGYNENSGDTRTGGHNLVIGQNHSYSSYGGLIAGIDNSVEGSNSTVAAGNTNTASGIASAVTGGQGNTASATYASVTGGGANSATAAGAVVTGGNSNQADTSQSVVSGGSGRVVTVLGGDGFDWVGGSLFESF